MVECHAALLGGAFGALGPLLSSGFPGLLSSQRLASLAIAEQKRRRWPSEAAGMAEEWQSIPSRRKTKASKGSASAHPSEDVPKFLAEFKTKECPKKERHDWRQCEYFHHQAKDRRRNPYKDPYLPEDEWNATGVEKAYHPVIFRTQLCESFAKGGKTCQYGSWCAFAHAVEQQREDPSVQHERYTEQFADQLFPKVQRKTLQDYVGTAPPSAAPLSIRKVESVVPLLSRRSGQQTQGLLLKPYEAWLLEKSDKFWKGLCNAAIDKLCTVEICEDSGGKRCLEIRGAKAAEVVKTMDTKLRPVPKDVANIDKREYAERTRLKLEVRIDTGHENAVQVCVVKSMGSRTEAKDVLDRIHSWLTCNGFATVVQCQSCCDPFFEKEGMRCPKGHFLCAPRERAEESSCLEDELDRRKLAQKCSQAVWTELHETLVDAQVSKQVQKLQHEFDERLQREVDKLMASYGNEDEQIRLKAATFASKARNEALSLTCPNKECQQVYVDFEGCMALECGICRQNFCGYCHKPTTTSRGAHEHVRECEANLTENGSYYADERIIREAQRRYRIKRLKQFFQNNKFNQRLRNAVVIELNKDLDDLGIDPAALFDFGNLQA
eukprot:s87_g15.t1